MEYNDREGKYLIKLLASVLNDDKPTEPPEGIDWLALYKLAKYHSVSNTVYFAIAKLEEKNRPPIEIFKAFEQDMNRIKAKEAMQYFALEEILKLYDKEQIKCMPLKGSIIKYLYPNPSMRSMSDIDILFEKKDRKKVETILISLGYELFEKGVNHDVYIKDKFIVIEMHYDLFSQGNKLYGYFKDFLYKGVLKDGFSYVYESNKEDFYIYLVAHLFKHYAEYAGTGIRSFMDLWVYKKHYDSKLDISYLNTEFKKINLNEFVQKIEKFSELWFGRTQIDTAKNCEEKSSSQTTIGINTDKYSINPQNSIDVDTVNEDMERYILSSGVYGKRENRNKRELMEKMTGTNNINSSKKKYLFSRIFPDRYFMAYDYPIVRKTVMALPFCWIIRLFRIMLNPSKAKKELHLLKNVESDDLEKLKTIYEETGL